MHVLVNGCSNTFGANVVDNGLLNNKETFAEADAKRLQLTYGNQLKELLGAADYTNLAINCGSNGRIVRTTLNWCLQQNKETLANTVAVIQWTHGMRYEYYIADSQLDDPKEIQTASADRISKDERWARVKVGVRGGVEGEPREIKGYSVDELAQMRFLLWTPQECLYRDIECYAALDSIFKSFGVRYFYWHLLGYSITDQMQPWVQSSFSWVNQNSPSSLDIHYDTLPCQHPSAAGHRAIGERIYELIKDRL